MKSLLVVGCLFLVAAMVHADTEEEINKFKELSKEHLEHCAKEQDIPESDIDKLRDAGLEGDDKLKLGCLQACLLKRMGVIEDTAFKPEKIKEILDQVFTDAEASAAKLQVAMDCIEEVNGKNDECEVAFQFMHCFDTKTKAA